MILNDNLLQEYSDFVESLLSPESSDFEKFKTRLEHLNESYSNVAIDKLVTAGIGLPNESGEFSEIVKKVLFQGKELTDETIFHLKRELGDIIFYWIVAVKAIGLVPADIIQENVNKLSTRYPGGFSVERSEKRANGDL